jgi:hypothetical protein
MLRDDGGEIDLMSGDQRLPSIEPYHAGDKLDGGQEVARGLLVAGSATHQPPTSVVITTHQTNHKRARGAYRPWPAN